MAGQHLGALVVADLEDVLDDLDQLGAPHRGELLARVRRGAGASERPDDRDACAGAAAAANTAAAAAAGSAERSPSSGCSRPSSTHSAVIGLTTSSGR